MFPCSKVNVTLFSITQLATCSCRDSHLMPPLFLEDEEKSYSSTKHSPSNVHRQLRALDHCERQAHLFLMHDL